VWALMEDTFHGG